MSKQFKYAYSSGPNLVAIEFDDGSYIQLWIGKDSATMSYAESGCHYPQQMGPAQKFPTDCEVIPNCG